MAGVSEANRKKIAMVLIGLGALLVLIGFLLVLQQSVSEMSAVPPKRSLLPAQARAQLLRQALFYLIVLLIVFTVSAAAFLRWSKRFRSWIFSKPHAPTPSEDVWAMHRLPEGAIDEWTDGEPPEPDNPHAPGV